MFVFANKDMCWLKMRVFLSIDPVKLVFIEIMVDAQIVRLTIAKNVMGMDYAFNAIKIINQDLITNVVVFVATVQYLVKQKSVMMEIDIQKTGVMKTVENRQATNVLRSQHSAYQYVAMEL